jgi:uncharacterized lipoprotein YbaY
MRKLINQAATLVALAGFALLVSSHAASQVARNQTSVTADANARAARTPYTAEYKVTHEQALADGTTITRETTEVKALDSQGRRLTATTTTLAGRAPITHVMVYDPVARTQTFWHSPGKVARVLQLSTTAAEHHCLTITRDDVSVASGPKSTFTSETLGTQSIQGIEARGRRYTTTIPAGAMGNDAPLVSISEMWTALAGLNGLVLLDVRNDPRQGKTTRELTNLTQSDPDPATFQPPEGYELVTQESSGCQDQAPSETRGERITPK